MAMTARQPKCPSMNGVVHSHVRDTIRTGGAAKWVKVPPIETLTNSSPSVAYFRVGEGLRSKNWRASSSAAIVMAAGSVMNEPSSGATVSMTSHHAAGVVPPTPASARNQVSASMMIGRVEASAMITTTNSGSV